MKWVVISLLLLNGIFLAMQLNKNQQSEPVVERFPFSGPKLVLLSEKEELDQAEQSAESDSPIAIEKNTARLGAEIAPVVKAEPRVPEHVPAPLPAPKREPAIIPAPKSVPKPVPTPVVKPKSAAMACYSVGPFLLISDVRGVSQLLGRSAIVAQERSEALRKQVGYWVYIPPEGTRELAQGVLGQLKEHGVSDAVIISEGAKANSISAGVYRTEAQGKQRRSILAELGYDAKVEPLFRTQPQYWLDLELRNSTQLPDSLWREVIAGYPKIKQTRRRCE